MKMENVSGHIENGNLVISLSGHIDSSNSEAVEAEITKLRAKNHEGQVILDAKDLEYISSAGLRIILRLSRTEEELKMINVSSAVYEVLEMTGFTEMIKIEKAFREISVEGCEVIGHGSNGQVYRLDPDTIIKVYLNHDALPEINRERELARKAFVLGIPTAIPYDVVKVGDSYGSVFELLNSHSFSKVLKQDPSKEDLCVKLSIDLLKKIHATEAKPGDMPNIKVTAVGWANYLKDYLPADQSAKLVKLINDVPDSNHIIHGDYHVKNIMMQKDEVLLIDMDTLSLGHPIFEFASMFLAYVGFGVVDPMIIDNFLGIPHDLCRDFFYKSMHLYLGTDDDKKVQEVIDKASIIGYARMMRRTIKRIGLNTPQGQPLIDACKEHLTDLLGRIDTLVF